MWLLGGLAADVPATGGNDALLTVIGGVVIAAIGGAVTIIVAALGRNKTSPSPPAPAPSAVNGDLTFRDYVVGEIAVLKQRTDDHDDAIEIQDRRLDQIERAKDHDHPDWRSR